MAKTPIWIIMLLVVGLAVVFGIALMLSISSKGAFASTVSQDNTLASVNSYSVNYGSPLVVSLNAPPVNPAQTTARCPQTPSTYAATSTQDFLISVDGTAYPIPQFIGYQNMVDTNAASKIALAKTIYTFTPTGQGQLAGTYMDALFSQQVVSGPIPVGTVAAQMDILPGNHTIRIYHSAGSVSYNQDPGGAYNNPAAGCQVDYNLYRYGGMSGPATYAEYQITVLNATAPCPGNTQAGVCQVMIPSGGCAPGQSGDGSYCYYPIVPPSNYVNSAQYAALVAANANASANLQTQIISLQSQLAAAQSVPPTQDNQAQIASLQAQIANLTSQLNSTTQTTPGSPTTPPPAQFNPLICIIPIGGFALVIGGVFIFMKKRRR